MPTFTVDLTSTYGPEAVRHLASAYEAVLFSVSHGVWARMPERTTREAIVRAMLAEGRASNFCTERMRAAGAAVARL